MLQFFPVLHWFILWRVLLSQSPLEIPTEEVSAVWWMEDFFNARKLFFSSSLRASLPLCLPASPLKRGERADVTFCLFQFLVHNLLERFSLIREMGEAQWVKKSQKKSREQNPLLLIFFLFLFPSIGGVRGGSYEILISRAGFGFTSSRFGSLMFKIPSL
jgi:hypothetical protein